MRSEEWSEDERGVRSEECEGCGGVRSEEEGGGVRREEGGVWRRRSVEV